MNATDWKDWEKKIKERNDRNSPEVAIVVLKMDGTDVKTLVKTIMIGAKANKSASAAFGGSLLRIQFRASDQPVEVYVMDCWLNVFTEQAARLFKDPPRGDIQPNRREAIFVQSFSGAERIRYHLIQYYRQKGRDVEWLGDPIEAPGNGTPQSEPLKGPI